MRNKAIYLLVIGILSIPLMYADDDVFRKYNEFHNQVLSEYNSYRDSVNNNYAEFLRSAWEWYTEKVPVPVPKEENTIPPKPFEDNNQIPIIVEPINVSPIEITPQPKPIEPILEIPIPKEEYFLINFYGHTCKVRLPESARLLLSDVSFKSISRGWEQLSTDEMNNTIRDCLEVRIRYSLCDWAYLIFLDNLTKNYCSDNNSATLLMAFLYCQSGYQMRLAINDGRLIMLYSSKHQIYNKRYYSIGDINFYPFGEHSQSIQICNAHFEGEKPLSLTISTEQLLGDELSNPRQISSDKYKNMRVTSQTPTKLIDFFNSYPTSAIGNNLMTRWAMYANTPLSQKTKDLIYPTLMNSISNYKEAEAANMLLNWVQTGFEYEYDDKIWGYDRAFFSEESLYYPYCDCEDRSILFSRIIRDLLRLDVALIYYPGHLATAVCFNEDISGDVMMIDGRRFIVCDPTYIGAPVGVQMPNLEYDKAKAIVLE